MTEETKTKVAGERVRAKSQVDLGRECKEWIPGWLSSLSTGM